MGELEMTFGALDPFLVTDSLRQRLARAVVAQARSSHNGLNAWLTDELGGIGPGALVGDLVIEGAPPYPPAGKTMAELANKILHPATVAALDAAGEQRFPANRQPFRHQLAAWEALASADPRSVLVSSGTGSGKTECFLVPLIDSLARQDAAAGSRNPLVGVQAIMLYPLNALIASQRERLSAWTRPFDGRVRFALYNGLLERDLRQASYTRLEMQAPEQVHDRKHLWAAPPPILVTNVTMLEYITIRAEDRPLLEKSAGKLKWIVIDEAHSYIGSAAAEIALLLRRVLLAFGVEAKNVRFVATSATIGRADEEGQAQLRRFLADLAGVSEDRVSVIIGTPDRWLPQGNGPDGPLDTSDTAALAAHPRVKALAERLQRPGGLTLSSTETLLDGVAAATTVLGALARPVPETGRPLLPSRIHRFLRAVPGLWSCIDPQCQGPKPADWTWGAILHQLTDSCPHCKALVLEIEKCRDCGAPYLTAKDDGDRLLPRRLPPDFDEFAAASETKGETSDESDDPSEAVLEPAPAIALSRLVAGTPGPGLSEIWIDRVTGKFAEREAEGLRLYASGRRLESGCCPACDAGNARDSALWPFRFGAPFLIGNAAPVMLDGVTGQAANLPGEGRRLLSFTDSRQGTARFAANIETQGERSYLRGLLYHMAQKAGASDPAALATLDAEISGLEQVVKQHPALAGTLDQKKRERAERAGGGAVAWNDAVQALSQDPMVDSWVRREVWAKRDARFEKPNSADFGRFLMLRELGRRPVRANSIETLGLARLRFPLVERAVPPERARSSKIDAIAWRDFLYLLIDRVRSNFAFDVPGEDIRWLLPRGGRRRNLVKPGDEPQQPGDLIWPYAAPGASRIAVVRMLAEGLGLAVDDDKDRATLNDLLAAAWVQLRPLFETPGGTYSLNFAHAEVAPVSAGWLCPVTRRVITVRAFGRTPYGVQPKSQLRTRPLVPLVFPSLPATFPAGSADRTCLAEWVSTSAEVAMLRDLSVWNNLHDRAAILSPYIRAEEHSAQQDAGRLRTLEKAFTAGEINLLACSTTMEMGVDIGPVEAVMMTNVPPSIANYRQRVGRAGRRGQGFATALTLARDTPLDRRTFSAPPFGSSRSLAQLASREGHLPKILSSGGDSLYAESAK